MARARPTGTEYEPLVCRQCLEDRRAQRMWLDRPRLVLVCPVHGDVITLQVAKP